MITITRSAGTGLASTDLANYSLIPASLPTRIEFRSWTPPGRLPFDNEAVGADVIIQGQQAGRIVAIDGTYEIELDDFDRFADAPDCAATMASAQAKITAYIEAKLAPDLDDVDPLQASILGRLAKARHGTISVQVGAAWDEQHDAIWGLVKAGQAHIRAYDDQALIVQLGAGPKQARS